MDYKTLYEHYKWQLESIYDPQLSVCHNCKKRTHFDQTEDSPEEEGCMGIEANLWTIGGCKEYE